VSRRPPAGSPDARVRLRHLARMLALAGRVDFVRLPGADASLHPHLARDGLTESPSPCDDVRPRSGFADTPGSGSLAAAAAALIATAVILTATLKAEAQPDPRRQAKAAAIHPVHDAAAMWRWLTRVPLTRDFPPDLAATLRAQAPLYVIEMTTAPGCVPCADLWSRLGQLKARYGVEVRTISGQEAMLRSGRLGLPWVGHPVAWVRPRADPDRMIPIAVGTDHTANLTRNLYLAAKMLTGVRPAVAVRAMSKFTGIVGAPAPTHRKR
jgi:hypothetical protein